MTQMIPNRVPSTCTSGEKKVFETIKSAAGLENYYCLHSVGLAKHKRKAYGEADFILIGPRGVFCLEAKGGNVSRKNGIWTIGWPSRNYTCTEGPFKQAQGTIYPLIDELENRETPAFRANTMIGWGVVFPDIQFDVQDPEWDLDLVCDNRHLGIFSEYIDRLSSYTRSRLAAAGRTYPDQLSTTDCKRIVDCFRRDFDLVPKVGDLVRESEVELTQLSEQQYTVLSYALAPGNTRILCPGGAGTGKTLIAIEAAKRLEASGKKVLFLCFNKNLAKLLSNEFGPKHPQIHSWSLHSFMRSVILQAGMKEQLQEAEFEHGSSDRLFTDIYPELFELAIMEGAIPTENQYDVLVIDEGQDILRSPTIDALGLTVKGDLSSGSWLFFFDPDLQSDMYGRFDEKVLMGLRQFSPVNLPLSDNYRNPEPIIDEMCKVTGTQKPMCHRKLKSKVEYLSYTSEKEQAKKLNHLLVSLIKDNVIPSSVTILSCRKKAESCIINHPPAIKKRIRYLDTSTYDSVEAEDFTACSVSAFKGLENDIIILTDTNPNIQTNSWAKAAFYVATTRARVAIYIFVTNEFLDFRATI